MRSWTCFGASLLSVEHDHDPRMGRLLGSLLEPEGRDGDDPLDFGTQFVLDGGGAGRANCRGGSVRTASDRRVGHDGRRWNRPLWTVDGYRRTVVRPDRQAPRS